MPEIMSAEKFADYIDANCLLFCYGEVEGLYITKTVEAIKSRDAAIIEKCKDKIRESKYGDEWVIRSILDSVLAEIGEE